MNILTILLAILIFGLLIFIHELGHFVVARLCGVKILEFALGMGPKILSVRSKKSGIVYSIRLFPIGGFVSMLGEDGMQGIQGPSDQPEEKQDKDTDLLINDLNEINKQSDEPELPPEPDPELAKQAYCNQSVWKRILISIAGPFMNVLLGFLLMLVMVLVSGPSAMATTRVAGFYVTYTADESYAGFQKGDYLYSYLDAEGNEIRLLSYDQFTGLVSGSGTDGVDIVVMRLSEDGMNVDFVTLSNVLLDETQLSTAFEASLSSKNGIPNGGDGSEKQGLQVNDVILKVNSTRVHTYHELGYEIMNQGYKPLRLTVLRDGKKIVVENVVVPTYVDSGVTFGDLDFIVYREDNVGIGTVLRHTWFRSLSTVKMVYDSLGGLASGRYGMEAVSGPVGITKTISDVAQTGSSLNILYLIIVISINLGVMNLLPLPAFDGGHIFLYLIELIRRKPLKREVEGIINFVGVMLILAFAVLITIKDVISL